MVKNDQLGNYYSFIRYFEHSSFHGMKFAHTFEIILNFLGVFSNNL